MKWNNLIRNYILLLLAERTLYHMSLICWVCVPRRESFMIAENAKAVGLYCCRRQLMWIDDFPSHRPVQLQPIQSVSQAVATTEATQNRYPFQFRNVSIDWLNASHCDMMIIISSSWFLTNVKLICDMTNSLLTLWTITQTTHVLHAGLGTFRGNQSD